ncbi:sporulation membrane protein YtrI [Terrilactibacillus laevilacticus]|uniref:Sporulation membrane protein YtrI n=1 Tax=Terrilactibacillus laevilacticus TaxID=1380157 RepID=A0ABW5PSZ3_9BACI|nr:sporulation membrane protein YtrI [Terrilactibacillus laevilacticus]
MRLPPYYRMPSWQRFLAGIIVGTMIGFSFFILLFGMAQERQIQKIYEQETKIKTLQAHKKTLLEEQDQKNDLLEKKVTIQDIKVTIENSKIEKILRYDLEEQMTRDLRSLINNDIESVAINKELIYNTIEKRTYTTDRMDYQFKIQTLVIFSTLEVNVRIVHIDEKAR